MDIESRMGHAPARRRLGFVVYGGGNLSNFSRPTHYSTAWDTCAKKAAEQGGIYLRLFRF